MIERAQVSLPFSPDLGVDILQGFHGPYSHKRFSPTKDLSYAVDFKLPIGTPVLVGKSGVVALVFDIGDKCYQGTDANIGNALVWGETNYAIIDHTDGTMGLYSHLRKNSGVLKSGQEVQAGQMIAVTGLSGWVGPVPHLHFYIYRKADYQSIEFSIFGYSGSLEHSQIKPI